MHRGPAKDRGGWRSPLGWPYYGSPDFEYRFLSDLLGFVGCLGCSAIFIPVLLILVILGKILGG